MIPGELITIGGKQYIAFPVGGGALVEELIAVAL